MVIARWLVLLLLLAASPAVADTVAIPGARLWVEVEDKGRAPYPQEMVLVRIRGLYTMPIALEKLEVPALPGFRVVQLGGDVWTSATDNGRPARALQRTLALFAQHGGMLTIPTFTHRLTVIDASGERREVTLASAPQTLNVAPMPEDKGAWWLPARSVTLTESWSVPPEALGIGQSTRRTVTLEAEGVADDQLPPLAMPPVPKLIAFASPVTRATTLAVALDEATAEQRRQALRRPGRLPVVSGRDGPRARATFVWDIRPTTDEAVELPAIEVPWFDTDAGAMRMAKLPAHTVAIAATGPSVEALEAALGIATSAPDRTNWPDIVLGVLVSGLAFAGVFAMLRAISRAGFTGRRAARTP
ncbi:protein BatD [Starkeya sp. ORNL1]|uniref:BatD family protein n=1 Tax=Starkeya sp. ORNL1 TaxID=2709380 RepID=UPI00146418C5|nr:BatD family protein [Starkeya sp. ORNL1]QJP13068.1 protein BatD [Starkeya sp. ORNL1]